jgi:hypothetical protein
LRICWFSASDCFGLAKGVQEQGNQRGPERAHAAAAEAGGIVLAFATGAVIVGLPLIGVTLAAGSRLSITYEGLATAFSRMRKKAGVDNFHLHDLRHTALTRTLRESKNLTAVKGLAGHSDVKTTMQYAHAMIDDVAEAMTARPANEAARRAEYERRQKEANADVPQKSPELMFARNLKSEV